jgi:hypothetical protein
MSKVGARGFRSLWFKPNSEVKKLWNQSQAIGARRSRRFTVRVVLGVRELRIWWMLKRPEGRAPFAPHDSTSDFGFNQV